MGASLDGGGGDSAVMGASLDGANGRASTDNPFGAGGGCESVSIGWSFGIGSNDSDSSRVSPGGGGSGLIVPFCLPRTACLASIRALMASSSACGATQAFPRLAWRALIRELMASKSSCVLHSDAESETREAAEVGR